MGLVKTRDWWGLRERSGSGSSLEVRIAGGFSCFLEALLLIYVYYILELKNTEAKGIV